MVRIIGGIVQWLDRQRGQVLIGGETLPPLAGIVVDPGIEAGTPVTALIRERDGRCDVVKLAANTAPRFSATVS